MDIFVIWTNLVARRKNTEVFEYFDRVKFYQSEKGWSLTTSLPPSHRPPRAFDIFLPLLSLPTTQLKRPPQRREWTNDRPRQQQQQQQQQQHKLYLHDYNYVVTELQKL